VKKMASNIADLKRALKGEIGMSQQLDELGTSMFNGQLPAAWAKISPQTEKPLGSWMDHYLRRYQQYADWINLGDRGGDARAGRQLSFMSQPRGLPSGTFAPKQDAKRGDPTNNSLKQCKQQS